jgi:flagellar motor switch protein FliM
MLSQSEIDALLGAVGSTEEAGSLPPPSAAAVALAPQRPPKPAKTYDFRRPDKFSKDQLRTLQAIHENVARIYGARLSARLRTPVSMSLADTSQMIFDEYVSGLTLPTQLVVMAAETLGGPFLIDFDLGLAYACVDRLLGGAGRIPQDRNEPTGIETDLIGRLIGEIIPAISEGWAHLQPVEAKVTETALRPALLRVAAPSHVVAVLTYEVRLAGQTAPLTVCYPHLTLEPLLPRLSASAWYSKTDSGADQQAEQAGLAAVLQAVEVPVAATLVGAELSIDELLGLERGDIIRFDDRFDQPIRLTVMDEARAWAIPGRIGDRVALRIVSHLQSMEA